MARLVVRGFVALLVLVVGLAAWALYMGNREVPAPTPQALQQHRAKAMAWLKANESRVLQDGNAALWWLLKDAAKAGGDPYLADLVSRATAKFFVGPNAREPWRRMLEPQADIVARARDIDKLLPYQRFFHHAMTCQPLSLARGDTSQFLRRDMCTPMATAVMWHDPVCTTHQLMGLMLYQQTGCADSQALAPLQSQLLDEIVTQLRWDPIMRDPYIQRVMMLAMSGRQADIRPVWLQRVLDAQEADGGWLGYRRVPELPAWIQPWHWREKIAQRWRQRLSPDRQDVDFHATAQAILLLTLLTSAPAATP